MFNSWTLFGDYFKWHGSIATDFEKASFSYCKSTLWKKVKITRKFMTLLTQITNPHTNDYSAHGKILLWMPMRPLFEFLTAKSIHDKSNLHFFTYFQARTMSYQQKVIENGNNSAAEDDPSRKTSLTSRPNIKELTHKQRNWFSSFEKNRSQEVVIFPSN